MTRGKRPRNRRHWSPPQHPDPKQKEFTPPLRRENDVARLTVKGWLKLAESALAPKDGELHLEPTQLHTDDTSSDESRSESRDQKPDAA